MPRQSNTLSPQTRRLHWRWGLRVIDRGDLFARYVCPSDVAERKTMAQRVKVDLEEMNSVIRSTAESRDVVLAKVTPEADGY